MSPIANLRDDRRTPSGAIANALIRVCATSGALVVVLTLAAMTAILVDAALPALRALAGPSTGQGELGAIASPLVGTLLSAIIALLVAVPFSLAIALYITEFAPETVARRAAVALEAVGAVPTLVFGMWGLSVLMPWLGAYAVDARGVGTLVTQRGGVVAAGIVLAIMLLPSLSSMVRKMFAVVPTSLREAAIAVGATRWEVFRWVVLPHVRTGVAGAVVLSLGRAMGEAMAVVLLIGNRPTEDGGLPSTSMAATLVTELRPGIDALHLSSLALLALCLLLLTFAVRVIGQLLVDRMSASEAGP